AGNVAAMAFLWTPDDRLANKYLEVTAQYLQMYEKLLGPFPYKKFALVENFWETGYGMPSFTLLGPRIIRFPFILHSSYPHELLHNWWGNSVFVDYESGNWSEGLTAYLADHLIKEQKGQGAEYRSGSLQKYADYVHKENDFSLSGFLSRRGDSTEAVGYGKSMMMWNMLRRLVGDEVFIRSFQHFYKNNKFKRASFNNIKKSFETVSQKELTFFFDQWVKRTGAPSLELSSLSVTTRKEDFQVSFSLSQTQKEAPYILNIPVAVYLEGMQEALVRNVSLAKKKENYQLVFSSRPLRVDIDPEFDIFRRLHRNEIPPSLSQAFGSEDILIILPFEAEKTVLEGYRTLALSWQTEKKNKIKIVFDNEISTLPKGKTVWVLGWKNRFQDRLMLALSGYDVQIEKQNVRFSGSVLHKEENSFIMVGRNPLSPEDALVFLGTDGPNALPGLGRKLPHYGKYSYLVFEGDEPTNIHKGRWPVINSPLTKNVAWENIPKTGIKRTGLPERKALAYLAPVFSEKAMMEHVQFLASEKLKGRGFGSEGLNEAADYIAGQFKKAGLQPAGDQGTFFQAFSETGGVEKKERLLKNVVALIPGKNPDFQTQSVILSAHYDHLGLGWPDVHHGDEGKIHFGADDNASGVSILIEIAKVLTKGGRPERTIIFVAFTGEEAGRFGSKHYIENTQKFPPERIIGVVNLDTVGRLEKNKVLVLGTSSAKEWKHIFMGSGFVTGVKNEIVSKDLDSSDQVSFIEKGIPAVQIFAGPRADYHRPSDTVEKIDAKGMVKIADFVREAVVYLADREGFLTTGEKKLSRPKKAGPKRGRKVRTGIMPDFSFAGRGVLIGKVSESSPADKAGLKKGDVVTRVDGHPLADLQEYSNRLKKYSPGDEVTFIYVRDGKENSTKIVLTVR
ncbi:MAG: M20/M25/M40 family metallo-hydrolase, partial [Nitrospinota bacterium]